MNTQEAYELMRVYLTRPGARQAARLGENGCMYETQLDGEVHRCAVGCLVLPETLSQLVKMDEVLAEEMEAEPNSYVALRDFRGGIESVREAGFRLDELEDVDGGFLQDAQYAHDDNNNWDVTGRHFKVVALDMVARDHGLNIVTDEPQGAPPNLVTA